MRIILSTAPPERAPELARNLVAERLAACVNIVPAVRSIYRWDGELCDDEEALLVIKTTGERAAALTERLVDLHPYDVPEVVSVALEEGEGNAAYLAWVAASVGDE
jgi:periplasmic divalent cation tolerance protein